VRDPARRGVTRVSDRVVAKIAARVAAENHQLAAPPRAWARVSGTVAVVRLGVAVRYPSPVPRVTAAVRDHVRRGVREMTGIAVESLDIEVDRLVPAAGRSR
jgi:uncharacterized alkaline shock family protein YloU